MDRLGSLINGEIDDLYLTPTLIQATQGSTGPLKTPIEPIQSQSGPLETPFTEIDISNIKKLLGPTLGPSIPLKREEPRGKIAQKKRADPALLSQSQSALLESSFSMSVPSIGL